jgi:protein TonB
MTAARFALRPHFEDRPAAPRDRGARYAGITGAIVFHAVLILALLNHAPVRRALAHASPIMVSVIPTPQPEPPRPPPKLLLSRKPMPTETPPAVEMPRYVPPVVTESTAVSPITLPPAPPPPTPVAEAVVAPDPPPVVPPRFNADYLQNPAPAYPALARRMREQGRVLIRVLVSADGMPERIELKTSSGFPRLDQSALETIRNWKFVPARQGEQKVAAWVVVPIAFTLDS